MLIPLKLIICYSVSCFLAPDSPPVNIKTAVHSSTAINVSWDAVPIEHRNGEIIAYSVNLIPGNEEYNSEFKVNASGAQTVTIGKLHPHMNYSFKVAAETSKGPSRYSSEIWNRTKQAGT